MVFTSDFWEKKCTELNQTNEQAMKYYIFWLVKSLCWMVLLVSGSLLAVFPVQRFCTEGINLETVDYLTKFIQRSLADIHFLYTAYEKWFFRVIHLTDNKFWFVPIIPFILFGYTLYVGFKMNPYREQLRLRKTRYYVHSNERKNI